MASRETKSVVSQDHSLIKQVQKDMMYGWKQVPNRSTGKKIEQEAI